MAHAMAHAMARGNSALISKGLRRAASIDVLDSTSRQFSPDFKGIETRFGGGGGRRFCAAIQP